jgi:hypothetical protein
MPARDGARGPPRAGHASGRPGTSLRGAPPCLARFCPRRSTSREIADSGAVGAQASTPPTIVKRARIVLPPRSVQPSVDPSPPSGPPVRHSPPTATPASPAGRPGARRGRAPPNKSIAPGNGQVSKSRHSRSASPAVHVVLPVHDTFFLGQPSAPAPTGKARRPAPTGKARRSLDAQHSTTKTAVTTSKAAFNSDVDFVPGDAESGDSESGDSESGDSESGDSESGESESDPRPSQDAAHQGQHTKRRLGFRGKGVKVGKKNYRFIEAGKVESLREQEVLRDGPPTPWLSVGDFVRFWAVGRDAAFTTQQAASYLARVVGVDTDHPAHFAVKLVKKGDGEVGGLPFPVMHLDEYEGSDPEIARLTAEEVMEAGATQFGGDWTVRIEWPSTTSEGEAAGEESDGSAAESLVMATPVESAGAASGPTSPNSAAADPVVATEHEMTDGSDTTVSIPSGAGSAVSASCRSGGGSTSSDDEQSVPATPTPTEPARDDDPAPPQSLIGAMSALTGLLAYDSEPSADDAIAECHASPLSAPPPVTVASTTGKSPANFRDRCAATVLDEGDFAALLVTETKLALPVTHLDEGEYSALLATEAHLAQRQAGPRTPDRSCPRREDQEPDAPAAEAEVRTPDRSCPRMEDLEPDAPAAEAELQEAEALLAADVTARTAPNLLQMVRAPPPTTTHTHTNSNTCCYPPDMCTRTLRCRPPNRHSRRNCTAHHHPSSQFSLPPVGT